MFSDSDVRARYGAHAVISRRNGFVLVHLDRPSDAVVRARTEGFDARDYFEEDCPLCTLQRASGVYVFDAFPEEDEHILIE